MKINKCFMIMANCFLLVLLSSCCHERVNWKKYETKNYLIDNSHIKNNIYRTKDGKLCTFPFLPSGLYLLCNVNELPSLDFQKRIEDVDIYPMNNVIAVYKKEARLIVETNTDIKSIDIFNPYIIEDYMNEGLMDTEKLFDTVNFDKSYSASFVQNALCIQDKRINKKLHVDYSTPVVNGIIRLCLYDRKFYFGQTLYSYFILDLGTDEVSYFVDKEEYEIFCIENIYGAVEILEAAYLYE